MVCPVQCPYDFMKLHSETHLDKKLVQKSLMQFSQDRPSVLGNSFYIGEVKWLGI